MARPILPRVVTDGDGEFPSRTATASEQERYGTMMKSDRVGPPNPNRAAAGRLNARKRVGFTEEGLERVRAAALVTRPWRHSTGPKTVEGKARSSENGRGRQVGERSKRELQQEMAATFEMGAAIARTRAALIAER